MLALPDNTVRALSQVGEILEISFVWLGFPACLDGGRQVHDTIGELIQLHSNIYYHLQIQYLLKDPNYDQLNPATKK